MSTENLNSSERGDSQIMFNNELCDVKHTETTSGELEDLNKIEYKEGIVYIETTVTFDADGKCTETSKTTGDETNKKGTVYIETIVTYDKAGNRSEIRKITGDDAI